MDNHASTIKCEIMELLMQEDIALIMDKYDSGIDGHCALKVQFSYFVYGYANTNYMTISRYIMTFISSTFKKTFFIFTSN